MTFKKYVLYGSIFVLTIAANLSIKLIPFKKLIFILTNTDCAKASSITEKQKGRLILITRLLKRIAGKVPWRVKCFEQAIVVLIFAKLLKIDMDVFFGISKSDDRKILVHAWTKVGDMYITGGESTDIFTIVYHRGYQSKCKVQRI